MKSISLNKEKRNMNTLFIIVGIAVVVFLIYVFTSHSNFASAIRALFQKKEQDAADAVDKVDSRVAAARSAQEGTVKKGRASLYSIQQQLAEVDVELGHTNSEIADDKAALAKTHQNNDRGAFDALVLELNRDTAHQNSLVDTRAEIVAQLKTLEVSVDEQRAKAQMIADQGRVMISKARVNDVIAEVNEARAGLTDNSADSQMEAAQKILDKTSARAKASQAAAEGLTDDERAQKKAQAYKDQVKQGSTGVNGDDLWKQMDSASQKPVA